MKNLLCTGIGCCLRYVQFAIPNEEGSNTEKFALVLIEISTCC